MRKFILYSLSWEQSDVTTRESYSYSNEDILKLNTQMRTINQVSEWMVLSTCNRTEVLTFGEPSSVGNVLSVLAKIKNKQVEKTSEVFQVRIKDALPYFAEVTTGLRSQILGDAQILNQVKAAYKFACQYQTVSAYTHRLMQLLFAANKKISTQTNFKTGISSVPYAVIDMAKEYMEMYSEPKIAVVGFGDMSQSICKYLLSKGVSKITIFNRSHNKVKDFFQSRNTEFVVYNLDLLPEKLPNYDIVFSAISARGFVISPTMVGKDREGFFQLLMDISLPRSIDPLVDSLEGVIRLDMDDIKEVTDASESRKQESIGPVITILQECLAAFHTWAATHEKLEVVRQFKQQLKQMEYGKLLALKNYQFEKEPACTEIIPIPLLIQQLVKEAVLSIKSPTPKQMSR